MNKNELKVLLNLILEFAQANDQVLGAGLCGSWARGTPHPDSDIDLSIISLNKESFRSTAWLKDIDFKKIDEGIDRFEDREYGRVWSRHVFLESGTEIEFSFADKSWAATNPLDAGTKKVVSDGYRILYDPNQILAKLVQKVKTNP